MPQEATWSWRKILKLREVTKTFLKFRVCDGSKIFLWLDLWHPDGTLYDLYRTIGTELFMMLEVNLMLSFQVLLEVTIGIGYLPDLRLWLRFSAAFI